MFCIENIVVIVGYCCSNDDKVNNFGCCCNFDFWECRYEWIFKWVEFILRIYGYDYKNSVNIEN